MAIHARRLSSGPRPPGLPDPFSDGVSPEKTVRQPSVHHDGFEPSLPWFAESRPWPGKDERVEVVSLRRASYRVPSLDPRRASFDFECARPCAARGGSFVIDGDAAPEWPTGVAERLVEDPPVLGRGYLFSAAEPHLSMWPGSTPIHRVKFENFG